MCDWTSDKTINQSSKYKYMFCESKNVNVIISEQEKCKLFCIGKRFKGETYNQYYSRKLQERSNMLNLIAVISATMGLIICCVSYF
jgi:hypothetical protein